MNGRSQNHIWSRSITLASCTLFLVSVCGRAAEPPKKVAAVEGITEYNYDNGLRVLLFPDQSKPTVTVNTTYFVGSRNEGLGETGMAHLLEHLVFKGTPTFPSLWGFFDQHGARFNGSTWFDRTNYFETMPASDENLDFGIHVAADCMVNSFIQKSDLDTEMTVVRNEFEMGENNPIGVLTERMENAAYLWHNYGKSTIGSKEDIERVPIDNLKAFYKKWYQPDNAIVVIAGKFEPEKALALVDKYFAPLPKPTRALASTYTVEPVQDGEREVVLRRNGDINAVGALYHVCAGSHPDAAALDAVQHVLTNKPSGRLYKALVDGGLASTVFGNVMSLREPGYVEFMAQVRLDQDPHKALSKLTEVMEGFDKQPVTAEETERAKAALLKSIELDLTQSDSIGIELSEWAAMGDWRLYFIHRDRIKELNPSDLQRVAAFYFTQSNRTTGIFLPTKTPVRSTVPETPDVVALVKDYKGAGETAEGEAFDATAENIEKRTKRAELPTGMKLALLPKSTRGKAVQARMTLHFGNEADLKGKTTAVGFVPDMLMRGTSKHTFQQIRDEFDKLKARVNIGGGGGMRGADPGSVSVGIETTNENLVPTLKLVHEILTDPIFPADEFETLKKEQLARMEQQLSDPQPLAFVSMMRRLAPYPAEDVRYVPTLAERVERVKGVTLDQVKDAYKKFYGASHAEFAAVGDFDENAVKKTVTDLFGGWKSPGKFERVVMPFRSDSAAGDETILTPDKKMAIVCAGLNVELKDDDPDYAPVSVANHILGGGAKSRFLERLRQKEGLSYGAGSFFGADALDRRGSLMGFAICATENADKAHDIMLEEFNKWYKEGITDEELTEAKTNMALESKNNLADDSYVASQLARGLYVGRTMEYQAKLDKEVQSLAKDQIQKAVAKFIDPSRLVKVKAGDLQKTSDQKPADAAPAKPQS